MSMQYVMQRRAAGRGQPVVGLLQREVIAGDLALPQLSWLTASEPLHEYAHALLMTALAGNGQRAAAVQRFEDLRQRLTSLLGLSPGAEVCAAQRRVLRDEIPSARRSPERPLRPRVLV